MKRRNSLILGIFSLLILGGGIGQFAFVLSNRSELIWNYSDRFEHLFNETGNDMIHLPTTPTNYLLVFSANHISTLQQVTTLDITFTHTELAITRHYGLVASSGLYQGWFEDGVLMSIPSGEYNVSWIYSGDGAYIQINIYINSIFNPNGDTAFFNEQTISVISGTCFGVTLLIGIGPWLYIIYKKYSDKTSKF